MNTIVKLYDELQQQLLLCATNFERSSLTAIYSKEIRLISDNDHNLTAHEYDIASKFGYWGYNSADDIINN
jgi:hypothetical protein